jgi:hypothetical protein
MLDWKRETGALDEADSEILENLKQGQQIATACTQEKQVIS